MKRTRLVIAGLPPLARGIVKLLAAERSTLDIVAEVDMSDDLIATIARSRANVTLISASAANAEIRERILMAHPRLRLLALNDDARGATLHRLLPHRMMITNVSPNELFDAILGDGRYGSVEWGT